jgi:hypothetical protein
MINRMVAPRPKIQPAPGVKRLETIEEKEVDLTTKKKPKNDNLPLDDTVLVIK